MDLQVKIRVVPFFMMAAVGGVLWWTRPSSQSFQSFYYKWLNEQIDGQATKNQSGGSIWARIGNSLKKLRDDSIVEVLKTASDIQHSDFFICRLVRVQVDKKVLTFIGALGQWIHITPPDNEKP